MIKPNGIVRFRIKVNQLMMPMCLHKDLALREPDNPEVLTCRACSISVMFTAWPEPADIQWYDDPADPIYRVITGTLETDDQRRALTRLLAFAMGHPDPLDLLAIENGIAPIWL